MSAAAAGGAAAAVAAMIQATRAMGVIVSVEPSEFMRLVDQHPSPIVVCSTVWSWGRKNCYLMPYKGLAFYCRNKTELTFPEHVEFVLAKSLWVPG